MLKSAKEMQRTFERLEIVTLVHFGPVLLGGLRRGGVQ